jgi:uncharacterized membrane protein
MQQQPPPSSPVPASQGGIDKKTGSWLAYLLGWITGVIVLFIGKNDPDLKFHGAQSIIFFGSVTVLQIVLNILSSIGPLGFLAYVTWLVSLAALVYWVIFLVKGFQGNGQRFEVPLLGGVITPYAERLANSVQ